MPPMIYTGAFTSGDYPKCIFVTNIHWVGSRAAPSQVFIPWWWGGHRGEQLGDVQGGRHVLLRRWTGSRNAMADQIASGKQSGGTNRLYSHLTPATSPTRDIWSLNTFQGSQRGGTDSLVGTAMQPCRSRLIVSLESTLKPVGKAIDLSPSCFPRADLVN
jgi:hypothetical protein